jgi:hypothetical protein
MEISIQIQFIKVNSSKSFRSYYLRRALSAKAELASYGHKQSNFRLGVLMTGSESRQTLADAFVARSALTMSVEAHLTKTTG